MKKKRGGFLLIEIIIALALSAISVTIIMNLYAHSVQQYVQARHYLESTNIAINVLERWYVGVPPASYNKDIYTVDVTIHKELTFLETIQVKISWRHGKPGSIKTLAFFGCKGING